MDGGCIPGRPYNVVPGLLPLKDNCAYTGCPGSSVFPATLKRSLPAGKGYTSIEIKVNYLKPVRLNAGPLTATGTVVKSGSRVGFTEGVVTDTSGAIVATATSTLLVFDL